MSNTLFMVKLKRNIRTFKLNMYLLLIELGSLCIHTLQSPFGVKTKQYYWTDKKTGKRQGPFPSLYHSMSDYKVYTKELRKTQKNTTIYVDFKAKKRYGD